VEVGDQQSLKRIRNFEITTGILMGGKVRDEAAAVMVVLV
jgi:hypothetical protein